MIKVVYLDGSCDLFKGTNFTHNKDHRLFIVEVGAYKVMMPDANVRSIGVGRIGEGGRFVYE